MLLRNRSRAVTKPGLMADHTTNNQNYAASSRTIPSSLFGSPKFRDFTNNYYCCLSGTEALKSPTSILDTRVLFSSPFAFANNNNNSSTKQTSSETRSFWDKSDSRGIGLALVGALRDDDEPIDHENNKNKNNNSAEPNRGNVLFGTQLRVKIPSCAADGGGFETKKTKDSPNSLGIQKKDEVVVVAAAEGGVGGVLSLSEMELSEEYTCVISRGPKPRTTHIFNNCIVEESYCSSSFSSLPHNPHSAAASANFLSVCYTCKKHLDQTKDIFIYRSVSISYLSTFLKSVSIPT